MDLSIKHSMLFILLTCSFIKASTIPEDQKEKIVKEWLQAKMIAKYN